MKRITTLIMFSTIALSENVVYSQVQDIGIDFKKKGFLRGINKSNRDALIDFVGEKEITTERIKLSDNIPLANLNAGASVEVEGEYFRKANLNIAKKMVLGKDYTQRVRIKNGRLDFIVSDYAIIDGHKVKLEKGTIVKGKNGYKKEFDALNKLLLGDIVNLSGKWQPDGFIYADSFTVEPDIETQDDQEVKTYMAGVHSVLYPIWSNKAKRKPYLGAKFDGYQICEIDALQEFVGRVGLRLIPDYIKSKINFVFIVINDDNFNACVFPNGLSFVNTGLLRRINNEAQLAAVLGHEIAHALYEHGAKRNKDIARALKKKEDLYRANKIFDLVGKISPGIPGITDQRGRTTTGNVNSNVLLSDLPTSIIRKEISDFSVEEELQADRVGLYLLARAGYDPREASIVWKNVFNEYGNGKIEKNSYFDSILNDVSNNRRVTTENIGTEIINSVARTKTKNNMLEAEKTHPYHVSRYADLLEMTYLFWSSDDLLKNSTRGVILRQ
ncbi:M48 family metallopeptidase [Runella sp. SP2]|uniref:M48 family metallopeptidase n=1 Tax=Runella sp. SP2 TaxID=2268026 RepID=UPI000F081704|nr:M48 family metallopeptidase [Runella sp. SP2]AYQ33975.1 M48 family peptidase [Runella sp. SP2]